MRGLQRYVSGNPFTHSDGWLYTNVVPSKAIINEFTYNVECNVYFLFFLACLVFFLLIAPFIQLFSPHYPPFTSLIPPTFSFELFCNAFTMLFRNIILYFVALSLCALFLDHLFTLFVSLFFHLHCSFLQLSPQVFVAFACNVRIDTHYVLFIVSHHTKQKFQDLVFCALICCFSCNTCTSSSPFFYLHYIVGFFVVLAKFMIFKLWIFFQSFLCILDFFIAHGYSN